MEYLQNVYRKEATISLSQVEYWATETIDERRRRRLKLTALLRDTDVMADVLGYLPRKVIALRLASSTADSRPFELLVPAGAVVKESGKGYLNLTSGLTRSKRTYPGFEGHLTGSADPQLLYP